MSVGLVLEGGGMRGLYTEGVLDTFLQAGIKADGIVAVSSGALFGVNFLSKQPKRGLNYNKRFIKDKRFIGLRSWLKTGNVVNKEFAYYEVPLYLDVFDQETYAASGVPFYVTVTNLKTGKPEYHLIDNVFEQMEWFRASSALPLASKIVEIDGEKYLDGGLSDSIPVDFARSLGFDKLIVILTRPDGYRKKPSNGRLYKAFYGKYPNFVAVASKRAEHYNASLDKIESAESNGQLYVIRPSQPLNIGRLEKDASKFDEIYQLGLTDTANRLSDLQVYLNNN
ncbi:patatin-like phospholipase family protein [Streptococcus dentiloxodontae]